MRNTVVKAGGVMEAAVRTAYQWATGNPLPDDFRLEAARGLAGVKEAELTLPLKGGTQKTLRIAIASGVGNARALLQRMMDGASPSYDFIEVMACPGGMFLVTASVGIMACPGGMFCRSFWDKRAA
jgi:NADH-quinone oxidoreductase subunit G